MSHEASFDKNEVEKLFGILKQATLETDEKFNQFENRLSDQTKDVVQVMEKIKAEVILGLQSKPEFQDLETMALKINTKADFQKV